MYRPGGLCGCRMNDCMTADEQLPVTLDEEGRHDRARSRVEPYPRRSPLDGS